jgi:hypothetical protein
MARIIVTSNFGVAGVFDTTADQSIKDTEREYWALRYATLNSCRSSSNTAWTSRRVC